MGSSCRPQVKAQPVRTAEILCMICAVIPCSITIAQTDAPDEYRSVSGKMGSESKPRQVPSRFVAHSTATDEAMVATPEMVRWLERLIRNNLPPTYEDTRKWGKQKEVWNGIKLRREGLKLETKRKKKLVNSGTWTRYAISLVEPEQRLFIEFHQLETLPDGRIAFGVTVDSTLDVFGRLSQWVRDVQLISLSANADAACRLTLEGTVQFQLNPLKLPPDVGIRPQVDKAHIELTYYRVRRISQVGGDFAKVLGNGLRKTVDDKIADLNGKLVDKINKQLEKHKDKLSFSAQDWIKSKLPLPNPASSDAIEAASDAE